VLQDAAAGALRLDRTAHTRGSPRADTPVLAARAYVRRGQTRHDRTPQHPHCRASRQPISGSACGTIEGPNARNPKAEGVLWPIPGKRMGWEPRPSRRIDAPPNHAAGVSDSASGPRVISPIRGPSVPYQRSGCRTGPSSCGARPPAPPAGAAGGVPRRGSRHPMVRRRRSVAVSR